MSNGRWYLYDLLNNAYSLTDYNTSDDAELGKQQLVNVAQGVYTIVFRTKAELQSEKRF